MSGSPREIWAEIMNRFDPERVTPREWRADRDESPAEQIIASLDRQTASPEKILLLGTVGCGKSTELTRVAEARAQKGDEFVIMLDLVRHFETVVHDLHALQNVSSWEVCFLAAIALVRTAKEQLGYDFPPEYISELADAWTKVARASEASGTTPPSIDILAVVKSLTLVASAAAPPLAAAAGASATAGAVAAGGFKALSAIAGSGKWTIPFGRTGTKPLDDQSEIMETLVDKINLLFRTFQQWNRRVLVIIDGLDRVVDVERAKSLFLHSRMISRLDCALVVCAPFALRNHKAAIGARGFRLRTLHNAPVLDHKNPKNYGPAVPFLGDVFRCRVRDLGAEACIPSPLLDKLAYYSGGRLRDFVTSIGWLAERGWDHNASVVTAAHVDDVIKEARLLVELGMYREDIDLLYEIAKDPLHRLPDGDRSRELLTYGRLLPYPNETEWFYPHPLLTLSLVRIP
jgi:hypothetical protein